MAEVARPRLGVPFPYVGGKYRLAARIVEAMPEHEAYVEVFGGSDAVLFAKPPCKVEVLNDVDGDVVNFFRVLRDERQTERLVHLLRFTPYAREEFEAQVQAGVPVDPVYRAWRFFVIARMSFGGYRPANCGKAYQGATRFRWRRSVRVNKCEPNVFKSKVEELAAFGDRLRGVFVERRDFSYVLNRWDGEEVLFYLDPPYVTHEGYYDNGSFGAVRHYELASCLAAIKGRAVVSYYPHETVDQLYPAERWRRIELEAVKNAQRTARGETRERTTELLLCNFDEEGRRL